MVVKETKPKKPSVLAKMKKFLAEGQDWDTKHFGVSDMIKLQVLPENKSNPKRLGLFITFQGRKGRKGIRVSNTSDFVELAEAISHDKTLEVAKNLDKVNPNSQTDSDSDL